MSQALKRKLEDKLDRPMSDRTWYRLLKNLREIGIENSEMDAAFDLLAAINQGKRSKRSRVNTIPHQFRDVWFLVQKFSKAFDDKKLLTCEEFRLLLESSLVTKPKPRKKENRVIGINTIWYTWFERAGLPYNKLEQHSISKFISVAAMAYQWDYKKQTLTIKQIRG
jgi:hypothetical protein